jgi:hypothetical protein
MLIFRLRRTMLFLTLFIILLMFCSCKTCNCPAYSLLQQRPSGDIRTFYPNTCQNAIPMNLLSFFLLRHIYPQAGCYPTLKGKITLTTPLNNPLT